MMDPQRVDIGALKTGDILLSRGDSAVSTGIVDLDGGLYSHAALWDGERVIESTLPCVRREPLEVCTEHAKFIDVYRHGGLGLRGAGVVESALTFLGRPYGTTDLLLATLMVAVSSWMPNQWSQLNTLYGAGKLARLLGFLQTASEAPRPELVTCSELVARAYSSAGLPIGVRLEGHRSFQFTTFRQAVVELARRIGNQESMLAEGLREKAEDVIRDSMEPDVPSAPGDVEVLRSMWQDRVRRGSEPELSVAEIEAQVFVAGVTWSADLVTPRLLQGSPDLQLVGRLFDASPS